MNRTKILGPPGCAKTTTLMKILEKELTEGVDPRRVAFLTFTRAARGEALTRTGKTEEDFPFLRTIHAICYRQLAVSQDQIVRPKDLRTFGKYIGIKLTGNNHDPWIEEHERGFEAPTKDDSLLAINHCGRHRNLQLREAMQDASCELDFKYAVWFTKAYRAWKDVEGMMDYTDLLLEYIKYGKPLDIDVIFVDEAQDLSLLQWEVVNKLGANAQRCYIAGDDDQAIFNWAGADSSVFQSLEANEVITLSRSYRVAKNIHKTATIISSRISKRLVKEYAPTESEGEVSNISYLKSVDFTEKTFILFRNHYRGQELARQLREDGVPFIGHGSPLQDVDVRLALVGWLYINKRGFVDSALAKKIVKFTPEDYLSGYARERIKAGGNISLEGLFARKPQPQEWEKFMGNLPGKDIINACIHRFGFLKTSSPNAELLSIHQSKGREAHTVIMDLEMSRATWDGYMRNPDDEHRVQYVGVTRAKEKVMFLLPDGNLSYQI